MDFVPSSADSQAATIYVQLAIAMGLKKYKAKRDFSKTAEPKGGKPLPKQVRGASRFVIQKHDARRLHYDFGCKWRAFSNHGRCQKACLGIKERSISRSKWKTIRSNTKPLKASFLKASTAAARSWFGIKAPIMFTASSR